MVKCFFYAQDLKLNVNEDLRWVCFWEGLIFYLSEITLTSDDDNKKVMSKKSVLYVKDDLFQ